MSDKAQHRRKQEHRVQADRTKWHGAASPYIHVYRKVFYFSILNNNEIHMDRNHSSVDAIQSIPTPPKKKKNPVGFFSAVSRQASWFKVLKTANKSAMQPSLKATTGK